METIFTRQNQEKNINRLAAQKQLYLEAKKAFIFMVILAVPLTALIAFIKIGLAIFGIDITAFVNIYSISIVFSELLLVNVVVNAYKADAAKIQEQFDCDVYSLDWHRIVVGKKPKQELVNKFSSKFKKSGGDLSKLYDWYPTELALKDHLTAVFLCQKTNLNYDTAIRTHFKKLVYKIGISVFVVILISALFFNYSLWDFIVKLFMSCLPVFTVGAKIIIDQNKAITNAQTLSDAIENVIESGEITLQHIRSVQDKIYASRKDSGLIPEKLYNKIRQRLEDEMHDNAAKY
ncbi:MAG: S-4TM family putative pore-forming effector [Candidatus Pedobacter colombiensis]|uniref:S-4TM family putative pore-forming effector n=1 Tax=Candidatus Pedobacter colombiensis TaxID=3121371 RepID=A0AAJ5W7N6_9SPHI|nr:S-4TM family putative pore-forming effector [Pedobacter sp.]WEK18673.1 MAG: S-4TM family putative pore-forming effector [Pedobacter sp.]